MLSAEVRMKRVLQVFSLLFVTLRSSTAFADHLYLILNNGSGDNFGFIGQMNGHPLSLDGGTDYYFFGDSTTYMPGTTITTGSTLYLYSTTIWVGGTPIEFGFPQSDSTIGINSMNPFFTLPTNGTSVTVGVQINFTALGVDFATGQTVVQVSGHSTGLIPYYFNPITGLYSPGDFQQTPEPGTLLLVGIGITGILATAQTRPKNHRM
jgi:hypothetical protein